MKRLRPVYLDLLRIRQPLPAIISLLHRISGVFLFLAIPLLLIALQHSLASAEQFNLLLQDIWFRLSLFFLFLAYGYHFFAGLRFLFMDLHWGTTLNTARRSSWIVLGTSLICCLFLSKWLW